MPFSVVTHKTVFTVYDLSRTLDIDMRSIVKTVLVRADRTFCLLVMPASAKVNFAKVKKILKVKKVSLAKEKDMKPILGSAGIVTPFGTFHTLPVLADVSMKKLTKAFFGCGSYTQSITMRASAYLQLEKPQVGGFTEKFTFPKIKTPKKVQKKKKKNRISKKSTHTVRRRKK